MFYIWYYSSVSRSSAHRERKHAIGRFKYCGLWLVPSETLLRGISYTACPVMSLNTTIQWQDGWINVNAHRKIT
jgi:hypothetical protein